MPKFRFSAVAAGLFVFQACASVENVIVAEPDISFSLPVGKTAGISGTADRLTFRAVRSDSRCPTSVVCVWEGDAEIEVTLSRDGSDPVTALLSLKAPNHEAQLGGYTVRFVGLAPYPATPQPSAPRQCVAELVIRKR